MKKARKTSSRGPPEKTSTLSNSYPVLGSVDGERPPLYCWLLRSDSSESLVSGATTAGSSASEASSSSLSSIIVRSRSVETGTPTAAARVLMLVDSISKLELSSWSELETLLKFSLKSCAKDSPNSNIVRLSVFLPWIRHAPRCGSVWQPWQGASIPGRSFPPSHKQGFFARRHWSHTENLRGPKRRSLSRIMGARPMSADEASGVGLESDGSVLGAGWTPGAKAGVEPDGSVVRAGKAS